MQQKDNLKATNANKMYHKGQIWEKIKLEGPI